MLCCCACCAATCCACCAVHAVLHRVSSGMSGSKSCESLERGHRSEARGPCRWCRCLRGSSGGIRLTWFHALEMMEIRLANSGSSSWVGGHLRESRKTSGTFLSCAMLLQSHLFFPDMPLFDVTAMQKHVPLYLSVSEAYSKFNFYTEQHYIPFRSPLYR